MDRKIRRRDFLKTSAIAGLGCVIVSCTGAQDMENDNIEQWGIFEVELDGLDGGNPFLDVTLSAKFTCGDTVLEPTGFYDGNGKYKIRCMPTTTGEWSYLTQSNHSELNGLVGKFFCVEPSKGNHGPVQVHNQFHFAYADGTPYYSFGTTCYAWVHQTNELEEQTLRTLKDKPFNKIRMCVFPKHYPFNNNDPIYYPFERNNKGVSDFTRFNPEFFHHFEKRLMALRELGIEADIIIFHPYDRWGYSQMNEESDYRYLRYLNARLSAFRNVWWSLANEYDFLLKIKPMERWDRFFQILQKEDPYQHLRSIHNGDLDKFYDHSKPWVTHVCIQNWDVKRVKEWRHAFRKPIVNDELEYEGNIPFPWGNISAEEAVHRFWIMVVNGGYAGHGETYMHPEDILWWSKGGVLHGDSWKGFGFLRQIIAEAPAGGLTPIADFDYNWIFPRSLTNWYWTRISGGMSSGYYLIYLGEHQMKAMPVWLENGEYDVDIIDTREMAITKGKLSPYKDSTMGGIQFSQHLTPTYQIELPPKSHLAIRITKI